MLKKTIPKYSLITTVSCLIFLLFASGEILILQKSAWPQLFSVSGIAPARWEETTCYLPFFQATSQQNLWPNQPHADKLATGASHFPIITNLVGAFIYHKICQANKNFFLLLTHNLLPVVSFWLLYLIFRLHLGIAWSSLLAFFSITYHSAYSFFGSTITALTHNMSFMPPTAPPEISRMPFPALSLPLFLLPFYLTLRSKGRKKSPREIYLLALLWAIQLHIYLYNFIAGCIFFSLWLCYYHYFTSSDLDSHPSSHLDSHLGSHKKFILNSLDLAKRYLPLVKHLSFFVGITLAINICYILKLKKLTNIDLIPHLSEQSPMALQFSNWGFLTAYTLPTFLLLLAIYVQRADIYEFLYRFTPILILFFTDLTIGLLSWLSNGLISADLHYHRISNIAFRFLWFIPLLYFISAPEKPLRRQISHKLFTCRQYGQRLATLLHKLRHLIATGGFFLAASFLICGAYASFYNHEVNIAPFMNQAKQKIELLQTLKKGTVMWESPSDNLLTPIVSSHNTIIAHSFSNILPKEALTERLVFYAKIFNWTEEQFLQFMLPGKKFSDLTSFSTHQTRIFNHDLRQGFGFWCIYHRQPMDDTKLQNYRHKILQLYHRFNVTNYLSKLSAQGTIHIIHNTKPILWKNFPQAQVQQNGEFFILSI